jgi:hypothetical protein
MKQPGNHTSRLRDMPSPFESRPSKSESHCAFGSARGTPTGAGEVWVYTVVGMCVSGEEGGLQRCLSR